MCVIELPFKHYQLLYSQCLVYVHSFNKGKIHVSGKKEKYMFVVKRKIHVTGKQNNIISVPKNLLHLLIPFVQNLTSTFSIWSEFSVENLQALFT